MSTVELAIGGLVFAAALTQGVVGFGFGLVVMSVLPRLVTLPVALPITAVFGLAVAVLVCWRYRRHASLHEMGPMLVGAALGLPLGVFAVRHLDADPCLRALGALIVVYVIHAAMPRTQRNGEAASRAWGIPAGFLGGMFAGAFAAGGPPVIAYVAARRVSPAAFKGVLQGVFVCMSVALVAALAGAGFITAATLRMNLLFAPLVILGVWFGMRYGDRLHPVLFRRVVLAALLVLGFSYLLRGA